ncbi:MAG: hypothetical protein ACI9QD_000385 [Thermoproteota archaeon]|jgi:hypothetical protein
MSNKAKLFHDFDNALTRLKMMGKLIKDLPKDDLPETMSDDAKEIISTLKLLWEEIEQEC